MKLFKKAKKGFTLVELVVVIAVIAILSAVSVGAYFGITDTANQSAADQEAKQVHTALMLIVNDPQETSVEWKTTGTVKGIEVKDAADFEADLLKQVSIVIDYNNDADLTDEHATLVFNADGSEFTYTINSTEKSATIDVATGAKVA